MGVKLGSDEMRYIALFESLTGATVRDCLMSESGNKITFVVKEGDIGLAIGKGGRRVQQVKRMIGKGVEVLEYSDDPAKFVKNIFAPARVKAVHITERDGRKVALVEVEEADRGLAVGKGGRKIQRVKMLALRNHEICDVSLT
jgi:N utilization substance protein A